MTHILNCHTRLISQYEYALHLHYAISIKQIYKFGSMTNENVKSEQEVTLYQFQLISAKDAAVISLVPRVQVADVNGIPLVV